MKEVVSFLEENKYGFLATVDKGEPRVRPFGFMFEEGGRLYFCTNSQKDVFRQLAAQPVIEYALTSKDMVTLRIKGEIEFCEDIDKKERALNSSELVKRLYQTADNPVFKVFFMEHGTAMFQDFSGRPPRKFDF